jgi:hypothetical protein
LKILKTKSTTLSDDKFVCQVSEWSTVWSEVKMFVPWLPRHAASYCDHFGLLWGPFWIQNYRQTTKILLIWAKFGFQVDYDVANWYPSFTGMLGPPFWILSTPQKLPRTTVDIPTKFHEVWWKESNKNLNLPFFASMATAAKLKSVNC